MSTAADIIDDDEDETFDTSTLFEPVYTVVENAGYDGERDARSFAKYRDALAWMIASYGDDEREMFHLAIARDDADGSRSYDC